MNVGAMKRLIPRPSGGHLGNLSFVKKATNNKMKPLHVLFRLRRVMAIGPELWNLMRLDRQRRREIPQFRSEVRKQGLEQIPNKNCLSHGFLLAVLVVSFISLGTMVSSAWADGTAAGAYATRVPLSLPQAPGMPALSLEYNSTSDLGTAGVGWDLSVGWPMIIARDTRFGTPEWRRNSSWLWGSSALVSVEPALCAQRGVCRYRFAPDSLATAAIDLAATPPTAEVVLPDGVILEYSSVAYDGQSYPDAPTVEPASDGTNVMAFVLRSATDSNGYKACFFHRHFGDKDRGRAAVLEEITYGPSVKDCSALPHGNSRHSVSLFYGNAGGLGYAVPFTMRFGAPVTFGSVLQRILIKALGVEQREVNLAYEPATATETRRPRLKEITETAIPGGDRAKQEMRTLRWFAYGNRKAKFGVPQVLDLGPVAEAPPPSLSGSISRPVRHRTWFGNPNGLFQKGADQSDDAAPPAHTTTAQWSLQDINGDGLVDTLVTEERGLDPKQPFGWTYESESPRSPRPNQQLIILNEGIVGSKLASSRVHLGTDVTAFEKDFSPGTLAPGGFSRWIWPEGRGLLRAGMPTFVTMPELSNSVNCPPVNPGEDTRQWPILPDGTLAGSQSSVAARFDQAIKFQVSPYTEALNNVMLALNAGRAIRTPTIPRDSISASLSNWLDLTGEGVPQFVVTPAYVHRYNLSLGCGGFAETPAPPRTSSGAVDVAWRVASPRLTQKHERADATSWSGPSGPWGMPLDYSVTSSTASGFAITVPVMSAVSAGLNAVATNGWSLAVDVPSLVTSVFVPRGAGGGHTSPSPSVTGVLSGLGSVRSNPATAGSFIASSFLPTFDLVFRSATTRSRTQNLGQVLDINADGRPDYVMFDSGGFVGGNPGDLLVSINQGDNGFAAPRVINRGFDYVSRPDLAQLASLVKDAETFALLAKSSSLLCKPPAEPLLRQVPCISLATNVLAASSTGEKAATAAAAFLSTSTDALPEDRERVNELRALSTASAIFASPFVAPALAGVMPDSTAEVLNQAAQTLQQAISLTERTVRRHSYRSRLNALSKGFTELDGSGFDQPANGISAQTAGFIDLNGDGLPDYINTRDRESTCSSEQWEVYWGVGTSASSSGRVFSERPACIDVPTVPMDILSRGYRTLPLGVQMMRRKPSGLLGVEIDTAQQTYVALHDFNHDGRPDLLIAGDTEWNAVDIERTWLVHLNLGAGFEKSPIRIASPVSNLTNVKPASPFADGVNVPYPGMRTSHIQTTPVQGRARDDLHASFVDIDGDGTADIVRRVNSEEKKSDGTTEVRAALLVWSRAGDAPQDILIEERLPVDGSRVAIEYRPSPLFQWRDGQPNGLPPPDGHYPLSGVSGHLVRSVTFEPLMGRSEGATRFGYDYRAPHFDLVHRMSTGFAFRSSQPLDPKTGSPISESILSMERNPQRPEAVAGVNAKREVIASTGAPVRETFTSFSEQVTAPASPGPTRAIFSAPQRVLNIEYPEGLKRAAIFDLGFDGRQPFRDHVQGVAPAEITLPVLLPTAPTGGAVAFGVSPTPLSYPSPHIPAGLNTVTVSAVAIEAWIRPEAGGTIVDQPGAYRLQLTSGGGVRFTAGGTSVEAPIPRGLWSHVVATLGGGTLHLFVNGVSNTVAGGPIALTIGSPLLVGCTQAIGGPSDCLRAEIGELRIYPEAWTMSPRVGDTERNLQLANLRSHDFGQVLRLIERNDLSTGDDDVVTEYEYAVPSGPQRKLGIVSSKAQRLLGANSVTSGNYLSYTETTYDNLPFGQVGAGNVTQFAQFDGAPEVSIRPVSSTLTVVNRIAYDPNCPGRQVTVSDALGFQTTNTWDSTCTFVLDTTNALGHRATKVYYGVSLVGYSLSGAGGPFGRVAFSGSYGLLAQAYDPNSSALETLVSSAGVTHGYDVWERPSITRMPLDRRDRPSIRQQYADAWCRDRQGNSLSCADAKAIEIASPMRTGTLIWDDHIERYRKSYTFGDGQTQTETLETGGPSWTISGVKDFDTQGRVTRVYKVRYLPGSQTAGVDACPTAGVWCDLRGKRDPLRDPATVAVVQTAYDARGRVVRTYGPHWTVCPSDPSMLDNNGVPACDGVLPAASRVHWTRSEYPAPGVTRVIDARGVPVVTRTDLRGLVSSVEEYSLVSTTPYATVRFNYDRLGRKTRIVDHQGHTATTSYDAMGRVSTTDDPDLGATQFKYDPRSQLIEKVVANGDKTLNAYDALGRIAKTDYLRLGSGPPTTACCNFKASGARPKVSAPNSWVVADGTDRFVRFSPVSYEPNRLDTLTPLPITKGDLDNGIASLKLPFNFTLTPNAVWAISEPGRQKVKPVSGSNVFKAGTTLFISTNGKIRLDSGGAQDLAPGTGKPLPTDKPEIGIYPFYADLDLTGGGISYAVTGVAPSRRLDIIWRGRLSSRSDDRVQFGATLFERDSEVRFSYDDVPRDVLATIGAQNHSLVTPLVFAVHATQKDGRPFEGGVKAAVSSHQSRGNNVLSLNSRTKSWAEIEVDAREIEQGELRLQHRWLSRCAQTPVKSCDVDTMQISYRDPSDPQKTVTLVGPEQLAEARYLGSLGNPKFDERLIVPLPRALSQKLFWMVFEYHPVQPPKSKMTWEVGNIEVVPLTYEIEERVLRSHDSAEMDYYHRKTAGLTTEEASALLDISFNVPGRIADRSPTGAVPVGQVNVDAVAGVAGWAASLGVGTEIEFRPLTGPIGNFTAEAWVRPVSYPTGNDQRLFSSDGIFALSLKRDGRLACDMVGANSTITSAVPLPRDAWAHVALIREGNKFRCQLNGVEQGSSPVGIGNFILVRTWLGDNAGTAAVALDEVRLLLEARNDAEVLADALRPLRAGPPRGNVLDIGFGDPNRPGSDMSRAGNHGAIAGGSIVPGVQGMALGTGNNAQIRVAHSPTLQLPEAVTVEAWLKTENRSTRPALIVGKWGSGAPGWRLGLEPRSGRLRWETITHYIPPAGPMQRPHAVFVTIEQVNDDRWHHVAATYDGNRLRVFIDGIPAHRTCSPIEPGTAADPCVDPPQPEKCATEVVKLGDNVIRAYGDAVCIEGTIENEEPVLVATDALGSLVGLLDEVRISNYAKREFEVAASSRLAGAYAQVLGREVEMRNQLPVGPQIDKQVTREHRAFDARGRQVSATKRVRGQSSSELFLSRVVFDGLDRVSSHEYPTGEVLVSNYDLSGVQKSLTGYGPSVGAQVIGKQSYLTNATMTPTGLLANLTFGNGVVSSFTHEDGPSEGSGFGIELLRSQSIASPSGARLSERQYSWSATGNLGTVADGPQAYNATYTHDDLDRISTANFNVGGQAFNYAYGYDSLGNLTMKEGVTQSYGRSFSPPGCGDGVTSLPHAATRRAFGGVADTLCYDQAGRLVTATETASGTVRRLEYFARGKLKRFFYLGKEFLFRYDGGGKRVVKTETKGTTVEPYSFYREIPGGEETLYAANGRLIARRTASDLYWYHTDHLGGTNLMSNMAGNEVMGARSHYRPFGEFLPGNAVISHHSGDRLFTGKELDATGLYDFGARYYDPVSGRFTQPDGIVPGRNPQAFNRFSYAFNSPLKFVDPTGHAPKKKPSVTVKHGDTSVTASPNKIEVKTGDVNVKLSDDKIAIGYGPLKATKTPNEIQVDVGPVELTTDATGRLKKVSAAAGPLSGSFDDTATITARVEPKATVEVVQNVKLEGSVGAEATVGVLPEHDRYAMFSLDFKWWAKLKSIVFGQDVNVVDQEWRLAPSPEGPCPNCGMMGIRQVKSNREKQEEALGITP